MSQDLSSLEKELNNLRAASLDEALLARMEACAAGSWTQLYPTEIALEKELRLSRPSGLDPELASRLESVLAAVPFHVDEKIVVFPKVSASSKAPVHKVRKDRAWAAVAAVAVIGAFSAFLIPAPGPGENTAGTGGSGSSPSPAQASEAPAVASGGLVPAGFNRGLSEASDHGVIWASGNRPHRVLKVVYQERVNFKDADGRTYQIEQPRVEYILVPARAN